MIIKTSYSFMKPPPSARLIRGHRLSQGLVAYWPFGEGGDSKQVFDLSGNGLGGSFTGTPTWAPGQYGVGIDFAAGDEIAVSASKALKLTEGTIVFSSSLATDVADWSYYLKLYYSSNEYIGVYVNSADKMVGYGREGAGTKWAITTSFTVKDAINRHIAMTWNSSEARLFSDGISIGFASGDMSYPWSGNPTLYIADDNFKGFHNYLMVYNRVLNASEIAELYLRPFGMFERKARTALMSGYAIPPVGMAGAMTTNTGYWGW